MTTETHQRMLPDPLISIRKLEHILSFERAEIRQIAAQAGSYYRPFDRRREVGKGKWRHIDNPIGKLKLIQQKIYRKILINVQLPGNMLGGVTGFSIKNNARFHIKQTYLITLDLRDCFPSIHDRKVFNVFKNIMGCSNEIASLLTKITTFQHRLPQGAPTSPMLANLTLLPLYDQVGLIANELDLRWTFWIDDIAISGDRAIEAIEKVIRAIQRNGHAVRHSKIRIMPRNTSQSITGTLVNRKVSFGRKKLEDIRSQITSVADQPEIPDYLIQTIRGKIAHVNSLCSIQGAYLTRLADRILPKTGIEGTRPPSYETRLCNSYKRHRIVIGQ